MPSDLPSPALALPNPEPDSTARPAPSAPRKRSARYEWTIRISVDASWVADGFDLDDERALEMLRRELPYAREDELSATVVRAPERERIRREQGYVDRTRPCDEAQS